MSLLRFLNYAQNYFAEPGRGGHSGATPTQLVSENVEEWVIKLRNDVVHGHPEPNIELLSASGNYVKKWLDVSYL